MLVSSTGRSESTRMSISGSSTLSSSTTQSTAQTAENANSPRVAADVQPQLAPCDSASRKRHEDDGHQRRAGHVDPGGRTDGRLGDEPVDEHDRHRDPCGADDEQPAPARVVDDQPGDDEPEPSADPEHRREEPDPDLHPVGRELVADDAEAEREDRACGAGDDAEQDQRPDVRSRRAADATDQERHERQDEQPLLAVAVAELAEDRREHGRRQEKARHHPRDPRRRRVELALELRQRRDDHRLLERIRGRRHRQGREGEAVVLACLRHVVAQRNDRRSSPRRRTA